MPPTLRRPDLAAVLAAAARADEHPPASLLDDPPAGLHRLTAATRLTSRVTVGTAARLLRDWDVHRRAGLHVVADGPATAGGTVALATRVGPVWVVAPCRVVEVVDEPERAGFTYATLPGHPEWGVERFEVDRDPDGRPRFAVTAVSRPAWWTARLGGPFTRWAQVRATDRYLVAARFLARAESR